MGLLHLTSAAEAHAVLAGSPKLLIRDGWLYMNCPGHGLFAHGEGEDTADECGHWSEYADRHSFDDLRHAGVGIPAFLKWEPTAADFQPVWFSIQESAWQKTTQSWKLTSSTSGCIGRPAEDLQPLSIYQLVD